jgi:hypothetical protein
LASDFIAENELPPLLAAAERQGVRIIPIILKPCAFSHLPELSRFQRINDRQRSVIALDEAARERLWYEVAVAAKETLQKINKDRIPEPADPTRSAADMADNALLWDENLMFFRQELANPKCVNDFFVYQYQHLDGLTYMQEAEPLFRSHRNGAALIANIKRRLKAAGWEGDGVLQILWLPPFLGAGIEDTWGVCIWHVKQSNNGTSWLASPVPLPFERLFRQN